MSSQVIKYIAIDPKILGGTPVITGTRIPIERIKELVKQGYTVDTLKREYPHVSIKKIQYLISSLMERGLDDYKKTYKAQIAL